MQEHTNKVVSHHTMTMYKESISSNGESTVAADGSEIDYTVTVIELKTVHTTTKLPENMRWAYCNTHAAVTEHYINGRRCVECSKSASKRRKLEHTRLPCSKHPIDTQHDAYGRCKACVKEYDISMRARPCTTQCPFHPQNTRMGRAKRAQCLCCEIDERKVTRARVDDAKKSLLSLMSLQYVRECDGKPCVTCGYAVRTSMAGDRDPRQKTMGRLDCALAHDDDPAQTQPQCWQCNMHQGTGSVEDSVHRLIATHEFNALHGRAFDAAQRALEKFPPQRLYRGEMIPSEWALVAQKKQSIGNKFLFNLTPAFFLHQFREVQCGQCWYCGLALGGDVSFERLEAAGGYTQSNVVFAHRACNSARSDYELRHLLETAKRVYERYRDSAAHAEMYNNFRRESENSLINND
jgi:hypothetical protein